jgi:hypothetical protein
MNVDLAEFQSGMARATDVARSNTSLMSAEMKRQSREGAESLRLIDEAIGVHISRPLTRVIAEIPGVGAALQSLFAISATAAIGGVLIEGIERVGEKIDEVREKPLAIATAWEKVSETFESSNQQFEKAIGSIEAHIAGLTSGKLAELNVEMKNLGTTALEAQKGTDALFSSIDEALKKSQPSFLDNLLGSLGDIKSGFDQRFRPVAAEIDELKEHFKSTRLYIEQAFQVDAIDKTHNALGLINKDLEEEQSKLLGMQNLRKAGEGSEQAVGIQSALVGYLAQSAALAEKSGQEDADAKRLQNLEIAKQKMSELQDSLTPANEAANKFWEWWQKINDELDVAQQKLKDSSFQDLNKRQVETRRQFAPYVNESIASAAPPGPPPSNDQAELIKIQNDQNEARTKAVQVISQVETAEEKYSITQQTLNVLLNDGLITLAQYNAALAQAGEKETLAEEKLRKLNEELIRVEANSTSAGAGIPAFYLQLQIDAAQNGRFAFDVLNQGLKGFEDNVVRTIQTGRANWQQYFASLEDMALKFALDKSFAALLGQVGDTGIGKSIAGLLGYQAPSAQIPIPDLSQLPLSAGVRLPADLGSPQGPNPAALQTASTDLITAGTTLNQSGEKLDSGAENLLNLANIGGSGGSGGGGLAGLLDLIPHAGGGDVTPGQGYLVGEQGPEPFFPGAAGTILPHSSLGGTNNHYYVDARGADAGVEQRVYRAMRVSEDRAVARSVTMTNEVTKRRPSR